MTIEEWLGEQNQLGLDIWHKKYQRNEEDFEAWLDRVSDGYSGIRDLIQQRKFLPGGRIMSNIGIADDHSSLMNCYSRGFINDDYNDIMQAAKDIGKTFKAQGGQGLSLSKLRPKGAPIGNSYSSDGIVPFMKIYNEVTEGTSQGGARKGALMISLDAWHAEAMNFITIKSKEGLIEKANISLEIDDEFMECVDKYYTTGEEVVVHRSKEYSGHLVEWDVKPIEIFKAMIANNYDWGDPGCLFVNRFRNFNIMECVDDYQIETCNPCLHPDTIIQTTEGEIKIKDMTKPMMVYCMDENNQLVIASATPSFKTRENAELLRITLNNGKSIRLTPNHLIYIQDEGWIEAGQVKVGQSPVALLRKRRGACYSGVRLSSMPSTKQVMEHRLIYEAHNGIIPEGYDIHHIDGNSYNNNIHNLALLAHNEHATLTRHECSNDHQVKDPVTGRFISDETSKHGKKTTISMPESMKTNFLSKPRIVKIEKIENSDVYDLTVERYHNFIADGIIVHNCGEQPLPKNMACCLSSLNLAEFVKNPYTENATFDTYAFMDAITEAVKYLDHIVDLNAERHPLPEQKENSLNWRNIGLGVFGYGSALMRLGMKYGSEEANSWTNSIFNILFTKAVFVSSELAKELGSFPKYSDKVWDSTIIKNHFSDDEINTMKDNGLRNCSVISIAPTGSLATMLGETGGCEPEYAISFTRRTVGLTDNEDHYYQVYCKAAREYMNINETDELPDYFIGSSDINPFDRIMVQSIMQNHVDTAISSTINLPESATKEEMEQIYLEGWKKGLKGLTIFRDNCKKIGILTTGTSTAADHQNIQSSELQRGEICTCSDTLTGKKRKIQTGCGSLHITAWFDPHNGELREVFLNKGSTGGCQNFMVGLSRMISLASRAGVSIHDIKDQLDSTQVCASYAVRSATKHDTSPGSCCPMAVGKKLVEMWEEMQTELNQIEFIPEPAHTDTILESNDAEKCPECGAPLKHEGGCISCTECGWSKC